MATAAKVQTHDIVVVGASAGGVEALSTLVSQLPRDLPAAVFVVQHLAPAFPSALPELLSRRGGPRAVHPVHGEEIVPGRIYVAPPDNHLLVRPGYVHVVRGPKENGHRPSVDALFRSASAAYGPRVVGVVLTGHLDCGTAGLLSVKARGGIAVVQDPDDAAAPEMPASAIQYVAVDHVARLPELPSLLERLVAEPVTSSRPARQPVALGELEGEEPGLPAEIVCPQCQGSLTLGEVGGFQVFRCHVGHAFSFESLAIEQSEEVERALWAAVRSLEESAAITRRARARATGDLQGRLGEKEDVQLQQADLIRGMLLHGRAKERSDVAEGDAPAAPGHPG
ncbi:chemotaxis protein CheB [Anaeromyxobacter diazotrophicus]|uniref:protein-glutamate methylesterase n=1 Tax=Anaeromyxobacter diazotrophicus TaxID=2590199 RepID=A0A7I9VH68_9BACT|nr:chemotaxis protein CheB [Anaeromyxobacter diazotrophicus]GEJ55488.1 chemotaxis protein CheB [Anaeromyxobacter diazotrophicus]